MSNCMRLVKQKISEIIPVKSSLYDTIDVVKTNILEKIDITAANLHFLTSRTSYPISTTSNDNFTAGLPQLQLSEWELGNHTLAVKDVLKLSNRESAGSETILFLSLKQVYCLGYNLCWHRMCIPL
jgi:hypothetical protein